MLCEFLHAERALIEVKLNECRVHCLLLKKEEKFLKMHTRATVSPTEFDYISLTFLAKRISHICTHTHTHKSLQGFVIFSGWMVIENSAYRQGVYIFVV